MMGRGERTAVKKIFLSVILTVFTSNNQSRNYKCFPDINSIIAMNRNRSNSRSSSQSSQRDSRQRDPPPEPSCRLFVGGIDPDVLVSDSGFPRRSERPRRWGRGEGARFHPPPRAGGPCPLPSRPHRVRDVSRPAHAREGADRPVAASTR